MLRALLLVSFPVLLAALSIINVYHPRGFVADESRMFAQDISFNPALRDHTANEFVKMYVKLLETLINTTSPKVYTDHDVYLSLQLKFFECYVPYEMGYGMFHKWLTQFVLHHRNAKIKVLWIRGDDEKCEMRLRIDALTMLNIQLTFDMDVFAANPDHSGWLITKVDRNIGCD